jgi:hypothetical protein
MLLLLLALLLASGLNAATLPTPDGWRTETIPFPLSFAPDLPHRGVEELRFAPGMFQEGAEDFWSYGFLWLVEDPIELEPERLTADLVTYFEGLGHAVRRSKERPPQAIDLEGSLRREGEVLVGEVQAFDAFVTQRVVPLHVRVHRVATPPGYAGALWFELSPQAPGHPVWETLAGIRAGYRGAS